MFPVNQIHIDFQEALVEDKFNFSRRLSNFLGLKFDSTFLPDKVHKNVVELPDNISVKATRHFKEIYAPVVREMRGRFQEVNRLWR